MMQETGWGREGEQKGSQPSLHLSQTTRLPLTLTLEELKIFCFRNNEID